MKCLDYDASIALLAEWDIQVIQGRQLKFPQEQLIVETMLPEESLPSLYFSEAITEWLPSDTQRLIWPSDWNTDPRSQISLLEKVRASYGDARPLIESPGMLFDEKNETEDAVFTGIFFNMIAFDWSGYLVAKNHSDYVYIFDTLAKFSCSTKERASEILSIVERFKLKIR